MRHELLACRVLSSLGLTFFCLGNYQTMLLDRASRFPPCLFAMDTPYTGIASFCTSHSNVHAGVFANVCAGTHAGRPSQERERDSKCFRFQVLFPSTAHMLMGVSYRDNGVSQTRTRLHAHTLVQRPVVVLNKKSLTSSSQCFFNAQMNLW